MLKIAALFFFLTIITVSAKAQNHGIVKAIILDSLNNQPIPFATVSILKLKDSSLVSYTITDKNGAFSLNNVREEPSRLLISHAGYQSMHIRLEFKKDEPLDLGKLYLSAKMLKEIIVKGERVPVLIKKDTIEFDAEAFKTRPNAVVEDLLKKLPGVQVDHDGHITVNGKEISRIKVDGKDFFINDPKIATKNLDAEMISKVQVYDDREDDPDHLLPDYQVKKIINLKFKKAFTKSTLSKAAIGAGTQDRYQGNGFFSAFRDALQISGTVNSNNLSGTDIFNADNHSSAFDAGSGIQKSSFGSLDINGDIGKKLKLNIGYEVRDVINNGLGTTQMQQFIGDTTFVTNSSNSSRRHSTNNILSVRTDWKPDTVTTIKFYPRIGYDYSNNNSAENSLSATNFIPLLSQSFNSSRGNNNSFRYDQYLNYYRKLKKRGASLSITNNISVVPANSTAFSANDLLSYTAGLTSDTLRRLAKNSNNTFTGLIGVDYHYPFTKKLSLDLTLAGNRDRNAGALFTYDEDFKTGLYTILLQDQSNNLVRDQWQQSAYPKLTYRFSDKISLRVAVQGQLNQINNHFNSYTIDLDQHFAYLLPSVELRLDKVTLSYGTSVSQPGINDLLPTTIIYDPLHTFIGNPKLKPMRSQYFNMFYFNYKTAKQLFISAFSNINIQSNTVVNQRTVSAEGAETTTPVNRNGRFTFNSNIQVDKTFKKQNKWLISARSSAQFIAGHNFFDVNQQGGYQNTYTATFTEEISANWNDIIELRPAYSVNPALTKYQFVSYPSTSFTSQKASLAMDVFLPQKFTWDLNYNYSYNPLVATGFKKNASLLSVSIARRIQPKDKGEFRLTCYDLLNQSVSSYHYAYENTINDGQNVLLRRYFMLSYSYKLNTFKK
ncbi:MAG: outer membrane beta-barrel protein [Bacteroidota bacterium]|nr:outer membrane beta-barrel protein [Bacteroidota bacterium]